MTTLKLSVMIFSLFTFSRIIADDNTMYVNAKRGLIVRERPGIKYKKLSSLPFGSEVKILEYSEEENTVNGRTDRWAKIKTDDSAGWVFNAYLIKEIPQNSFQRIPNKKIESFLRNYKFGKLLNSKKIGRDECNGASVTKKEYDSNTIIISLGQHRYDYLFKDSFEDVLGISNGSAKEQVLKIFGNPYSNKKNEMEFISEKPEGYESEYFESRWRVIIHFKENKVNQIRILELFDDC